jgi:hypothetical protein
MIGRKDVKRLLQCSLAILLFFDAWVSAATFHAVIVGDTNHPKMGERVKASFDKVVDFVEEAAKHGGVPLNPVFIEGKKLQLGALEKILNRLAVASHDVVFFYYAGDGFNGGKEGHALPTLAKSGESVEFSKLADILRKKSPQLLIAAADVSNDFKPDEGQRKTVDRIVHDNANYRQFLFDFKGSLVVASAHPQQLAGGNALGGYFTTEFIDILNTELRAEKPSWENVIKKVENWSGEQQHPVIDGRLSSIRSVAGSDTKAKLFSVEYLAGGKKLTNKDTLPANINLKIRLIPGETCRTQDCSVEIINVDSNHKIATLFPREDIKLGEVVKQAVTLPAEDSAYSVNEKAEEETIYVLVTSGQKKPSGKKTLEKIIRDGLQACTPADGCIESMTFKFQ